MLVIHQAILIPDMPNNLLCPMQLRDHGLSVNDEPKYMALIPTDDHHAITFRDNNTQQGEPLRIPLDLHGVTSYFPSRKPSRDEYELTPDSLCVELTAETPDWDPLSKRFQQQEEVMVKGDGQLRDPVESWGTRRVISLLHSMPQPEIPDFHLSDAMSSHEHASGPQTIGSITSGARQPNIQAAQLSRNWGIGLETAARTIEATTQKGLRTILHNTLSRRFRTNDRQLRYRRLMHEVFTDTLESPVPSWFRQNRYAQVFATRFGWSRVFPMRRKADAHDGLSLLAQRDGVPLRIIMDGSKEQTMGLFRKKAKEMGVHIKQTEPHSPWQNAAELSIRELKKGAGRRAMMAGSPKKLWDHALELESYIRSNTAIAHPELDGQVPETIMSGQTADISHFATLRWYDWIKYYDPIHGYPEHKEILGRWLGPAVDIGPAMTCKILKANGQIIYTSTYRALTDDEMANPDEAKARHAFDSAVSDKLGAAMSKQDLSSDDIDADTPTFVPYEDDVTTPSHLPDIDEVTPEVADSYVGAQVNLPIGGTTSEGTVKRRARDTNGNLQGKADINPILDSRTYEVEFLDGRTAEFSANAIAEHMFTQCDPEVNQYLLLDSIIDHEIGDTAITNRDRYIHVNGRRHHRKTTRGVRICVRWKNGATTWERLVDLKQSYPLELAEYAIARGIDGTPAFSWWVPYVIKKRKRILAAVQSRYHKRTHKFGFEITKTIKQALEIDQECGNTLWKDAIAKEMANVKVAFKILPDDAKEPVGHQYMECHLVYEIKLDGFRRKARLVAGGHMTEAPAVMTYASVVSRETVRIALTIAALNDLEVKASDVQNAYLTAPCAERIYTRLGPEFGPDQNKLTVIVRALYGLKSAGASFGRHISDCMRTMGFEPCKADPDLWYRPATRPDDGFKYYEYVLLYVDDCLAISHDAISVLKQLDKFFQMKPGSIGDPDIYLGAKLRQVRLNNGITCWSMSSAKYVQEAVRNVEDYIDRNLEGRKLKRSPTYSWPTNYTAKDDESPELPPTLASYYQHLIGILHWIVELGRVDLVTEVSLLASQMAMPRQGHLDAALRVVAHLKSRSNARMVFDPTYPDIYHQSFNRQDWVHFYGDVKEAIPTNAPEPRGKDIDLRLMVDSDHAGDKVRRRSRTGFYIFLNSALIAWISRHQPTIETSVFGAEFVAMKHGVETLRGIRYKLRMMGVPLDGPSYVYGDNMSVINNTQEPESVLKKKSNSICYHAIREAVAMGEILTTHIATGENVADLATKVIMNRPKRDHLIGKLLFDICDDPVD